MRFNVREMKSFLKMKFKVFEIKNSRKKFQKNFRFSKKNIILSIHSATLLLISNIISYFSGVLIGMLPAEIAVSFLNDYSR